MQTHMIRWYVTQDDISLEFFIFIFIFYSIIVKDEKCDTRYEILKYSSVATTRASNFKSLLLSLTIIEIFSWEMFQFSRWIFANIL